MVTNDTCFGVEDGLSPRKIESAIGKASPRPTAGGHCDASVLVTT